MKVRIPRLALSLALAAPVSYAAIHTVRTVNASDALDTILSYSNVPDRISDVVTIFKMLPERMNSTRSECN